MLEGPEPPVALAFGIAAELYGAYCWLERRLYELTGAWAGEAAPPEVQIHLDEVSWQHAWHSELWSARLPVLDGIDPEALTRPSGPAAAPLLDALAELDGPVERLAGLYRVVLPRLLATYARHLRRGAAVADAPGMRALRLVRWDEIMSWEAGEALLQGLLTGPEEAAAAAGAQQRLESSVVASGVSSGIVPWPSSVR